MATTHCLYACRHDPDDLLKFKLNFRIGKKEDLCDFKWGGVFWFFFLISGVYLDGRVRICCTVHEYLGLWCCNGVADIFLVHFGPLKTN